MAEFFAHFPPVAVPSVSPAECTAIVRDCDIFFTCGTDPAAVLIHLVTGSPISHCGFLFRDGATLRTVESTFSEGVHIGEAQHYIEGSDGPFLIGQLKGLTPDAAQLILAQAKALVGRHYEVGEEIAMAFHAFLPFIRVKPEWNELYCSGMIEDAVSNTPWAIPLDRSGGNATPVDVWTFPLLEAVCAVAQ